MVLCLYTYSFKDVCHYLQLISCGNAIDKMVCFYKVLVYSGYLWQPSDFSELNLIFYHKHGLGQGFSNCGPWPPGGHGIISGGPHQKCQHITYFWSVCMIFPDVGSIIMYALNTP